MQLPKAFLFSLLLPTLVVIPACSVGANPQETSAAPTKLAPKVSEAMLKRGKMLFVDCQICHALKRGQDHRVGPNLFGFYQRRAASAKGFGYSEALKAADITWDREHIDDYLANPGGKVPGTSMDFAGVAKVADRNALIEYLKIETQP